MCYCLKPTRPGPLPGSGRLRCGYHCGKGRTVEAVAKKLCLVFEGSTSDGCSHKEEGGKRDRNIQKVESIIGCASQPFSCVRAAQSRTVQATASPSETLYPNPPTPSAVPSYSVHPSHLFSLLHNTLHWIVTLDYIIMISFWFLPPAGGNYFLDNYHLIMMQPWCWAKLWVLEAERGSQTPKWRSDRPGKEKKLLHGSLLTLSKNSF